MRRFQKLFYELGYCNRNGVGHLVRNNIITIDGKKIKTKDLKSIGRVDPDTVLVNGSPLMYQELVNIAFYKPENYRSDVIPLRTELFNEDLGEEFGNESTDDESDYYSEEEDENLPTITVENRIDLYRKKVEEFPLMWELFPEQFPFRRPILSVATPLSHTASGLMILTQYKQFKNLLQSVRTPIKRVYEVEVEEKFTGLEPDMFQVLRGDVKRSVNRLLDPPKFEIINETGHMARITLNDYKPDNIEQMMLSIRHVPVKIHRTQIGNLSIDDLGLESGQWSAMDQSHIDSILDQKRELVKRRERLEKDNKNRLHMKAKKEREALKRLEDFEFTYKIFEHNYETLIYEAIKEKYPDGNELESYAPTPLTLSPEEKRDLDIIDNSRKDEYDEFYDEYFLRGLNDLDDVPGAVHEELTEELKQLEDIPNKNRRQLHAVKTREDKLMKALNATKGPIRTTEMLVGPSGKIVDSEIAKLYSSKKSDTRQKTLPSGTTTTTKKSTSNKKKN
ncbi:RNA pseudouridine synthase [Acrasis kona]|uniref:RNA pseudouridine synthase n=1 Tax=Acrasis kona TaxID=1008807 RepID=A0AAW2Z0D8_9EUKA